MNHDHCMTHASYAPHATPVDDTNKLAALPCCRCAPWGTSVHDTRQLIHGQNTTGSIPVFKLNASQHAHISLSSTRAIDCTRAQNSAAAGAFVTQLAPPFHPCISQGITSQHQTLYTAPPPSAPPRPATHKSPAALLLYRCKPGIECDSSGNRNASPSAPNQSAS